MDIRAIIDNSLREVALDCKEKQIVGLELALRCVSIAEHLYSAIDFAAEEDSLSLHIYEHRESIDWVTNALLEYRCTSWYP